MTRKQMSMSESKSIRNHNLNPREWLKLRDAANNWGTFEDYLNKPDGIQMGLFGTVPKQLVCGVDINVLFVIYERFGNSFGWRFEGMAMIPAAPLPYDELKASHKSLLEHVGAFNHQLRIGMARDILLLHEIIGSFWLCCWYSFFSRSLMPHKYHAVCGTPSRGYGFFLGQLMNIPDERLRVDILQSQKLSSWKQYVDRLWKSKSDLMEMEAQYRELSLAVAQVGMGMGGMILGVIGLALSLVVTYWP